jgi:hypothetical protein
MRYNPWSILDAHVAMETDLRSMHSSQPLIATGKRENLMSYSKRSYKKMCRPFCRLGGKRCKSHFKAYTRAGTRRGASTITTIIA